MSETRAKYNATDSRIIEWCLKQAKELDSFETHELAVCHYGDRAGAVIWAVKALSQLDEESTFVFEAINGARTKRQLEQAKRERLAARDSEG
jgi:hypothetical protein